MRTSGGRLGPSEGTQNAAAGILGAPEPTPGRVEPSFPAEQRSVGSPDGSARGGAGRPTGGPTGLPGGDSSPGVLSPVEGGGEPRASPALGPELPSSAAGYARWPLSVRVDGHRIETLTAAVEYLKAKHGGRCTLERKGKFWMLKRRGEEIACYTVREIEGDFELVPGRLKAVRPARGRAELGSTDGGKAGPRPRAAGERPASPPFTRYIGLYSDQVVDNGNDQDIGLCSRPRFDETGLAGGPLGVGLVPERLDRTTHMRTNTRDVS